MDSSIGFLSNVATLVTVFMFLCPFNECRTALQTKSVSPSFNILPYVTTAMTCTLWFTYGMMTDQPPLIRVNSIGIVLEIAYSAVFFRIARTNKNAKILVGALAFTFSVLALTYIVEPPELAVQILGIISCSVNIICFASPLTAAKEVIRTKSTEALPPLVLQLAMFFTPLLWFFYAHLIDDSFVAVPNGLGALLGVFQLYLRYKYTQRKSRNDYLPLGA